MLSQRHVMYAYSVYIYLYILANLRVPPVMDLELPPAVLSSILGEHEHYGLAA